MRGSQWRHGLASRWPWCRSGETGAGAGGEEPCRAGTALVCGEQPLPVRGPMGCCPKHKGKTAARGLGAQQLHCREQLRQAPVSAAGSCVPGGATSCCDRCWFPVALAHPTGHPQAPCAEQGWAGSEEQPWGAARREAGICARGGGGRLSPPALSPVSLTEGMERTEIQGRGGFGVPLPTACALAEVPQGGVG